MGLLGPMGVGVAGGSSWGWSRLISALRGPACANLMKKTGHGSKWWHRAFESTQQFQIASDNTPQTTSTYFILAQRLVWPGWKTCIEDGLLQGWELHSSAHAVVVFACPLWKHTGKSRASVLSALRLPQTYLSLTWEKIKKTRGPLQRANVLKTHTYNTHMHPWFIKLGSTNVDPMWGKADKGLFLGLLFYCNSFWCLLKG